MLCPICQKRKAKRFCPARGEKICAVCCGTEREVSIDCPSDCPYLIASRAYEDRRQAVDWSKVPFAETKIPSSFVLDHDKLLGALSYAICLYARNHHALVDSDVLISLKALAETYQTLSRGIHYENMPEYRIRRELYDVLKGAVEDYKRAEEQRMGLSRTRDGEIRDALVLLTQVGSTRANGRPKGRAYLDFLRNQFDSEDLSKLRSDILLLP